MKINQLIYFAAVDKYGSFSKAAAALYVSQPSISVAIRELEEELGYPLILRGNKGVSFTLEGLRVLERARVVLAEIDNIRSIKPRDELSGSIHIGGTPHYCNSILLEVKLGAQDCYPLVDIRLEENDSNSIIERVAAGELHLGVVQLCDVDTQTESREKASGKIGFLELFREEMCCVVGEHHPLVGAREQIPVDALLEYPYATYKNAMNQSVSDMFQRHAADRPVAHISEIVSLRRFIMRTNCYTVIPRRAVEYGNRVYNDKLVPIPVAELELCSAAGLVHRATRQTRLEQAIQELLINRCHEYSE